MKEITLDVLRQLAEENAAMQRENAAMQRENAAMQKDLAERVRRIEGTG